MDLKWMDLCTLPPKPTINHQLIQGSIRVPFKNIGSHTDSELDLAKRKSGKQQFDPMLLAPSCRLGGVFIGL